MAALVACLLTPASALAHAVLIASSPTQSARLARSPTAVTMRFNEPVQILAPADLTVVDGSGNPVNSGPGARLRSDARQVRIPLRPSLPDGTYTVRYLVVSADSHVVGGYFVFGVGPGELKPPFLGGAGQTGPSETSAWAVSARFLELLGVGGLVGLLAFRWFVWWPAWRSTPATGKKVAAQLAEFERDGFWMAFGALSLGAMLAEGYLLIVKSASALGVGVLSVMRNPGDVSTVLGGTHFGTLVQARGALLFGLFAVGAWQFMAETSDRPAHQAQRLRGRPVPALGMASLSVATIVLIAAQGHASQAPYSTMQVVADVLHLGSVSVWIAGLACIGVAMWRLPRFGDTGSGLAARLLASFSRVALVAVALAILTGVTRSAGELTGPAQLWDTAYGRSILYKLLLLCPIGFLALRHRRVVTSLRAVAVPSGATLRMVRRSVGIELGIAIVVVVVASVLAAQVPGRV
jgi:copper transport protein